MSRLIKKVLISAMILTISSMVGISATPPAQPHWEQVETIQAELSETIMVRINDGYIYVTTSIPTAVKIFTILGQPVSQANIPAGTSRLKLPARGIYILKAGSVTKRITI